MKQLKQFLFFILVISACAIKIPAVSQFPSLYVCYFMLIFVNIINEFEER
jgi:hypothetical protein